MREIIGQRILRMENFMITQYQGSLLIVFQAKQEIKLMMNFQK